MGPAKYQSEPRSKTGLFRQTAATDRRQMVCLCMWSSWAHVLPIQPRWKAFNRRWSSGLNVFHQKDPLFETPPVTMVRDGKLLSCSSLPHLTNWDLMWIYPTPSFRVTVARFPTAFCVSVLRRYEPYSDKWTGLNSAIEYYVFSKNWSELSQTALQLGSQSRLEPQSVLLLSSRENKSDLSVIPWLVFLSWPVILNAESHYSLVLSVYLQLLI